MVAASACLIAGCSSVSPNAKIDTLEGVFRTLPPKYLADSSFESREQLLTDIQSDEDTYRWDPANKWMNYFSDSGPVPPTSMIYLKVFAGVDGHGVLFVHMPKPHASGEPPSTNQTFVLKVGPDGNWQDVTRELMPPDADLTAHYSPTKTQPMIEVALYERYQRADGKGEAYGFGKCTQELWWNGSRFELRNVVPRKLANLL